jgi:hypothetical protein
MKKYMYPKRKIRYKIDIVHASPALLFAGWSRIHVHITCHNPLIMGGIPPLGTTAATSGGRKEVALLITLLVDGMMTPGWVKNTIKNVPA